jgi:hypothetical protein
MAKILVPANGKRAYIRAVKNFSLHFGKSPDKLTFEHVREYQLNLAARGLQAATIIPIICAIRFFYGTEELPPEPQGQGAPIISARRRVVRAVSAITRSP